jgi:hypothetical protein
MPGMDDRGETTELRRGGWLRVKVGWITRTEVIPLPTEFAVSPINKWPAWCNSHPSQP